MTEQALRVLFADLSGAGRRAIAALLRSLPGIALVAEAGSLEELALERRRTGPDVIVIDDRLLGGSVSGRATPTCRSSSSGSMTTKLRTPRGPPRRDGLGRQGARRRVAPRRTRDCAPAAQHAGAATNGLTLRESRNGAAGCPRCAASGARRA